MSDLAHAILSLSNRVASNVEHFETLIEKIHTQPSTADTDIEQSEKIDTRAYVVSVIL